MTTTQGRRRVVVTGEGAVTPLGTGVDKFWAALKAGECGIGPASYSHEELRIHIAGEVKDFAPVLETLPPHIQRADKYSQFAGAAAFEAMRQSGLKVPLEDGHRAASIIGSGSGGLTTLETAYEDLFRHGKRKTNPLTLIRALGSSAAAHVSMEFKITGPVFGVVSACASASHAIGLTFHMIRNGLVDLGFAGGAEASLLWGATRSWEALFVLSPKGCFPFSKRRDGTVLAEGGGVLVLEELSHAKARGAKILGEILGFGMSADAGDMVHPKVEGAVSAMRLALEDAGLSPTDIDYVNAHGTGTRINDTNETRAIKELFGKHAEKLAISSTKSMHGHLLGGGGAVESIACLKAIEDNFIPPTINLTEPDPECDLDYTPNEGRPREVTYAMNNSLAFGGMNVVLIFGPPPA